MTIKLYTRPKKSLGGALTNAGLTGISVLNANETILEYSSDYCRLEIQSQQ